MSALLRGLATRANLILMVSQWEISDVVLLTRSWELVNTMARKSSVLLKSQPVKLTKLSETVLADIKKMVVPPGTEEQFDRYLNAAIRHEEQYSRIDILAKKIKDSNDPNWAAFQTALRDYDKTHLALMGAIDAWQFAIVHLNQTVSVSFDDLSAVIWDSLSDKVEEIQFSNLLTQLAGIVVAEIYDVATEHEMGAIPLCSDCS